MSGPLSLNVASSGYKALYAARHGTAVSPEADVIRRSADAVVDSKERSIALFGTKAPALSAIRAVAAEHAEEGWDGEGAQPISPFAVGVAEELIRALPEGVPMPAIAAEPDGEISLDWIQSRTRLFSGSVSGTGRLAYTWLDGADRGHGVTRFDLKTIPPRILDEIGEIMLLSSDAAKRVA